MVYEAEIRIQRSDPKVLADDFQAVTALLNARKMARETQSEPAKRSKLHLVGVEGNRA